MTSHGKIALVCAILLFTASLVCAQTVQLQRTGQTVCYDESGDETACAGTGQDGEYRVGVPWGSARFEFGPSGICATDHLTGVQSGLFEHSIRFYPNGSSVILSLPFLLYKSVRPYVKVECIFLIDSSPVFNMIL